MDTTARLALALLTPGQVSKEWYHNESLVLLDMLVGGTIEAAPIGSPPASPAAGALYLVAASGASAAFAGQEGKLAGWTEGGWRFINPVEGLRLMVRPSGVEMAYWQGQWRSGSVRAEELVIGGARVVGSAAPAIANPTGGSVIDAEGRACLLQILSALRTHGLIQT